jgi:hypothetical protein
MASRASLLDTAVVRRHAQRVRLSADKMQSPLPACSISRCTLRPSCTFWMPRARSGGPSSSWSQRSAPPSLRVLASWTPAITHSMSFRELCWVYSCRGRLTDNTFLQLLRPGARDVPILSAHGAVDQQRPRAPTPPLWSTRTCSPFGQCPTLWTPSVARRLDSRQTPQSLATASTGAMCSASRSTTRNDGAKILTPWIGVTR